LGQPSWLENEQKEVGRGVDLRKAVLRHAAQQTNTVGDPALVRQPLDGAAFGALADDHEFDARQLGQRLYHQVVALQRDEIAGGAEGRPRQAEGVPRRVAVAWVKQGEIHPIAQHPHPLGGDAELDQLLLQPARHGDQAVRVFCRPTDPPARNRTLCDDVEIAATGGDDDRAAESPSEQHGSDPIRIEVVRIDQIEVPAIADLPRRDGRTAAQRASGAHAHTDLGQQRIARMIDMHLVAGLSAWDPASTAYRPNNADPIGNHGQGATTRAPTAPLSTSFLRRVSTKIRVGAAMRSDITS